MHLDGAGSRCRDQAATAEAAPISKGQNYQTRCIDLVLALHTGALSLVLKPQHSWGQKWRDAHSDQQSTPWEALPRASLCVLGPFSRVSPLPTATTKADYPWPRTPFSLFLCPAAFIRVCEIIFKSHFRQHPAAFLQDASPTQVKAWGG